jgi:hypothetical protein
MGGEEMPLLRSMSETDTVYFVENPVWALVHGAVMDTPGSTMLASTNLVSVDLGTDPLQRDHMFAGE